MIKSPLRQALTLLCTLIIAAGCTKERQLSTAQRLLSNDKTVRETAREELKGLQLPKRLDAMKELAELVKNTTDENTVTYAADLLIEFGISDHEFGAPLHQVLKTLNRPAARLAVFRYDLSGRWNWIAVRRGNSFSHPEGGLSKSNNETHYYFGPNRLIIEYRPEFQPPRLKGQWELVSFDFIGDDVLTAGLKDPATQLLEYKTFKLLAQNRRLEIVTPAIIGNEDIDREVLMLDFIDHRQVPENY